MKEVFSPRQEARQLAAELARGGEGAVYPLADRDEVLVKVYHPEVLKKRGTELRAKIEAMQHCTQLGQAAVSWPRMSVFAADGQWLGYAMRRASGVPMAKLAHAVLYQKHFPQLDRVALVAYLRHFLSSLRHLHQQGIYVGDYNLNNLLCDSQTQQVNLIDCDSYQLEAQGQFFPCPVGSQDMTPPEHHGVNFSQIRRNESSELFSVAIVLFKCLMLGRHPYDAIGGEDPVKNIVAGKFPYGMGNNGIPQGPWYNVWSHMPHRLKTLFIQTFQDGAHQPQARVSLDEWRDALKLYQQELGKGWHAAAMRPDQPKSKAYRGNNSQNNSQNHSRI